MWGGDGVGWCELAVLRIWWLRGANLISFERLKIVENSTVRGSEAGLCLVFGFWAFVLTEYFHGVSIGPLQHCIQLAPE
jgi:hypothetical protein